MLKIMRQDTMTLRTPVVLACAAALVALTVAVVIVVVPGLRGSPRVDPSVLYGRWVENGNPCDTLRGDIEYTADMVTGHEAGHLTLRMRILSVAQKPPNGLELKIQSLNGQFTSFAPVTVKDADTIILRDGAQEGIWRKCPP